MKQVNYDIKDGIIYIDVRGNQTASQIKDKLIQVAVVEEYFGIKPEKAKLLVDLSRTASVDRDALSLVTESFSGLDVMAVAVVRPGGFIKSITDWIAKRVPVGERIQVFDDRETARQWLINLKARPSQRLGN